MVWCTKRIVFWMSVFGSKHTLGYLPWCYFVISWLLFFFKLSDPPHVLWFFFWKVIHDLLYMRIKTNSNFFFIVKFRYFDHWQVSWLSIFFFSGCHICHGCQPCVGGCMPQCGCNCCQHECDEGLSISTRMTTDCVNSVWRLKNSVQLLSLVCTYYQKHKHKPKLKHQPNHKERKFLFLLVLVLLRRLCEPG